MDTRIDADELQQCQKQKERWQETAVERGEVMRTVARLLVDALPQPATNTDAAPAPLEVAVMQDDIRHAEERNVAIGRLFMEAEAERDEFKRLLERFAECGPDGGWRLRGTYTIREHEEARRERDEMQAERNLARGKLRRAYDMLDPAVIARAAEAVQAIVMESLNGLHFLAAVAVIAALVEYYETRREDD